MARIRTATGTPRSAISKVLDTLQDNLPDLMQGFVLAADPSFDWRTTGSVYQYTRFEVLRGMLGGSIFSTPVPGQPTGQIISELWATSSLFMNDAKEFERGREVLEQEIVLLPDDEIRSSMRSSLGDADALEVYCTCFSAVGDD